MDSPLNEPLWHALTEHVMTGMHEWRLQHPTATLRAIETELDGRLNHMRARLLEDLALRSAATTWQAATPTAHPTCPDCGTRLQQRGTQPRTLRTHGGQALTLDRGYGVCPACGAGLFPPR
jgi:hypothetical protein